MGDAGGAQAKQSHGTMLACSPCTQSMGLGANLGDSCRAKPHDGSVSRPLCGTSAPVLARRLCLCSRACYQPRFRSSVTCVLIKALGRELFVLQQRWSKGGQTPSDPSSAPSFLRQPSQPALQSFPARGGIYGEGVIYRTGGIYGPAALLVWPLGLCSAGELPAPCAAAARLAPRP